MEKLRSSWDALGPDIKDFVLAVLSVFDTMELWLRARMPSLSHQLQTVVLLVAFVIIAILVGRMIGGGLRLVGWLFMLLLILHVLLPALKL